MEQLKAAFQPKRGEPIGNGDIIGRRLQTNDVEVTNGGVKYSWKAFFDTRIEENLSVDFLGSGAINKKQIRILIPVAQKDFQKSGKPEAQFIGWAGMRRKTVNKDHSIIRTPVTPEENPDNPNPHHCDIVRDKYRDKTLARSLAFELCGVAEADNLFEKISTVTSDSPSKPEKKAVDINFDGAVDQIASNFLEKRRPPAIEPTIQITVAAGVNTRQSFYSILLKALARVFSRFFNH